VLAGVLLVNQELVGPPGGGDRCRARACAMALAAEGCFVTVAGRTEASLEDTVRAITEAGGSA